jgi:hypothetical protein
MIIRKYKRDMFKFFCLHHLHLDKRFSIRSKYIQNMGLLDLLFITYRIMPFVMVSYLVITSLFSNELSGFFILIGLLLSSLITIGISKSSIVTNGEEITTEMLRKCNLITLGNQVLSNLPLSTHTFAYIFSYFLYVTTTNKIASSNVLLLTILASILAIDVVFNFNHCAKHFVLIPLLIGGLSGLVWAATIGPKNQMKPGKNGPASCSVNKNVYSCKIKRSVLSS